ncbi:energy-coupling factor transporter transmembrane component T [Plantibacter sp. Mn2098]|uniref:energy-coupling factor transporter transmembrane component T n=1 Tax=Plantibacter sp. Mn2098 TaxID=3395266 RepID=UPI003BD9CECC
MTLLNSHGSASGQTANFDELAARFRATVDRGNPVKNTDPIAFLAVLTAAAVVAGVLGTWESALVVSTVLFVIAALAGVARGYLSTWLKIVAFVGVLLFLTRAAFAPGTHVLFQFVAIKVTAESIAAGLDFSLTVMAVCGAVVLMFTAMPMTDLLLALEQAGMTPRATYVVLASFQAITDLAQSSRVVMDAQRARGVETQGGPITRMRAFLPVLAPVFLTAIASTEERAVALDARAFNATAKHTHLRRLRPMRFGDIALISIAALAIVVVLVGKVSSWW